MPWAVLYKQSLGYRSLTVSRMKIWLLKILTVSKHIKAKVILAVLMYLTEFKFVTSFVNLLRQCRYVSKVFQWFSGSVS